LIRLRDNNPTTENSHRFNYSLAGIPMQLA